MYQQNLDILLPLSQLPGITLTASMLHTLEAFKKCRTAENGGRIFICQDCKTKIVLYNPCNKRGCPICYKKNQLQWQKKTERKIVPSTHYHLTFSIPDRYTALWIVEKKEVMESLFIAVREAIKTITKESRLLIGSLLAFQSHGRGMSYKPHMHCILSAGGLDINRKWIDLSSLPLRAMEKITEEVFEREIHKRLRIHSDGYSLKTKQYRVFVSIHEKNGKNIIEYVSKSRNGVVIDMGQELKINESSIEFRDLSSQGEEKTRLSKKTFIQRYLNHIPLEGSVVARYYGLYSNRHRDDLKIAKEQLKTEKEDEPTPYRELCPKCYSEMKVLEIIKKTEKHIFKKYETAQGPPKHGDIINAA